MISPVLMSSRPGEDGQRGLRREERLHAGMSHFFLS